MNKIWVAPSILSADFARMGEEIERLDGVADIIHCDVMDGMFVPNISFGPKMVADIRKHTKLPLDVHMMVQAPERYVDSFIKSGADYITIHLEACDCIAETLKHIRAAGVKCGVVVNPGTDVEGVREYLPLADMVLLMSVNPGFGGQKFIPHVMEKIRALRKMLDDGGHDVRLEIDGGICTENVEEVKHAGADVIVAGSYLFGAADMKATADEMRRPLK